MDGHALAQEALREVAGVAPEADGSTRRWFTSRAMDLFVWHDPDGRLTAFQLAWGKPTDEHLATWDYRWPDRLICGRVDDGEWPGVGHKATPVLAAIAELDASTLRSAFEGAATAVPPAIRDVVLSRLGAGA